MAKIPMEYQYAWYILRYHEKFNGNLSDHNCMRKIAYETGGVNMLEYTMRMKELEELSDEDLSILKGILEKYGLYVDL